ncbi:histidine kinase, partial [Lactobacillus sp. XV13L]|nr:histidine kinase [Lactobacillus sp. XV13L]
LMGHLPVGVMLLDNQGNVLLHNPMLAVILGKQIAANQHPFVEDIQTYALSRMIEHTLRKNRNHHRQIQLYGDSDRFVDANVIRIAHSAEDLEQPVIVILYDLTPIHQLEQQRVDFLDKVSQKLQPSVQQMTTEIAQLLSTKQFDIQLVEQLQEQVQNLNELLTDTIALNHYSQQDNTLPQRFNIEELIQQILTKQDSALKKRQLQVEVKIKGNKWISSYPQELQEIIQNLISNAVKYNKEHGQILVLSEHNEVENYLNLTVQDSGIGIAEAEQKQIFERFYQVNPQKKSGSGLG